MHLAEYLTHVSTLHREAKLIVNNEINKKVFTLFEANKKALKEEFFFSLESSLAASDGIALNNNLIFLLADPIENEDRMRFQNIVIASFAKIEQEQSSPLLPLFLNFTWSLLDYTLNGKHINDEQAFFRALTRVANFLETKREQYPDATNLLLQKISQFGLKNQS